MNLYCSTGPSSSVDDPSTFPIHSCAPQTSSNALSTRNDRFAYVCSASTPFPHFSPLRCLWQVRYLCYLALKYLTHHMQHPQHTREHCSLLPHVFLCPSGTSQLFLYKSSWMMYSSHILQRSFNSPILSLRSLLDIHLPCRTVQVCRRRHVLVPDWKKEPILGLSFALIEPISFIASTILYFTWNAG